MKALWIFVAFVSFLPLAPQAATPKANPNEARKVIDALLAQANTDIPEDSTCAGDFGQEGRPKVKDLLASQMAYLSAGRNMINSTCSANRCKVSIKHAKGEDVSSTSLSFTLEGGNADISTLQCVITP